MKTFIAALLVLTGITFCNAQIIDGYTDKQSYVPGETVIFYTKSIQSFGTGTYALKTIGGVPVSPSISFAYSHQNGMNTNEPWKNGYNYAATASWVVPVGLKSGMYILHAGVPFAVIIKGDNSSSGADIVVVCPTNTDEAYVYDDNYPNLNGVNSIGMYGQLDVFGNRIYSPIVSFHRPIKHIDLTDGFLDWLYNSNYTSINVIADVDMDNYSEIENAKLLIVIGHSEYWTRQARLNFDRFVDEGNDAMILSGNSMWWQVRYENDNGNPQMICYRGSHGAYPQEDPICDPLLETTSYDKEEIKYSTLSSIVGAWRSGYNFNTYAAGNILTAAYVGFSGYKITVPGSPLLANTGLQQGDVLDNYAVGFQGELDVAPFVGLDANSDPIFDFNQLGFYRGEMIGYDIPAYDPGLSAPPIYSPLVAIQKSCTSGKVINVNANYWCNPDHFSNPQVQTITQNMIDLLLAGSNIFVNNTPDEFNIVPGETVSFSACLNGAIDITPCGVTVAAADGFDPDGYRVDNADFWDAKIIDCTTCNRGARMASTQHNSGNPVLAHEKTGNEKSEKAMIISPGNGNGNFIALLRLSKGVDEDYTLSVFNTIGKLVFNSKIQQKQESINIDLSSYAKGIYFIKLLSSNGDVEAKKVVVK